MSNFNISDLENIDKESIIISGLISIPLVKGGKGDTGEKGDKGDKGRTGKGFRYLGQWSSMAEYGQDPLYYIDTVSYNGNLYACILPDSSGLPPENNQCWEIIAQKGEQGIQGTKGDTGVQGEKGDKGDTGEQGIKGATGEKGEQGIRGGKWFSGNNPDDYADEVIDGDMFLERNTGNVYRYTTTNPIAPLLLQDCGNIKGPKGDNTPIKGTDYFTEEEIQQFKNEIESKLEIDSLKRENKLLKSQFPTEKTEKSKSLVIKDGSNLPFKNIEISGDTEQEVIEEVEGTTLTGESITANNVTLPKGKIGIIGKTYQETTDNSPSLAYPSEVRGCGEDINIFNHATALMSKVLKINGELEENDNYYTSDFIEVEPKQYYCLKKYDKVNSEPTPNDLVIVQYDENKACIIGSMYYNNSTIKILSTAKYIRVSCLHAREDGELVDPKLKIQEGKIITPYSKYGQGNISIVKSNKNIFDKNEVNKLNAYFISNTNIVVSTGAKILYLECMPNTTYTIQKVLSSRFKVAYTTELPKVGTAVNGIIHCDTNTQATITTSSNAKYLCIFYYNPDSDTLTEQEILDSIMIEVGNTKTSYIPHQEETKIVPVQKPFYEGDTFIKKSSKWYEQHNYDKYIFTGNESWNKSARTDVNRYYVGNIINTILTNQTVDMNCSHFKAITGLNSDNGDLGISKWNDNGVMLNIELGTELDTLDKFKSKLVELYNTGTPVYIVYKLATPELIECTAEQNEILDELDNTDLYIETTHITTEDEIKPTLSLKYNYVVPSPSLERPSAVRGCGNDINIFDGEMESGSYDFTTGAKASNTTNIRNVNPIEVKPNNEYIISNDGQGIVFFVFQYTQNMTFIKYTKVEANNSFITDKTTKYINIFKGTSTVDKLKIQEGKIITPYSPYGQGSISIKKSNKNLAKFDENYFQLTNNNRIKNTKRIDSAYSIKKIKIKKGETIKCRLKLFSKPTKSTTFTAYKSNPQNNNLETQVNELTIGNIQNYSLNTNYDKTFTATEDCEIFFRAWGNEGGEIFEFQFSASLEDFTDYIPHQEKTYIIPTQKPFYKGDHFNLENNKEVHVNKKYVFTGDEAWIKSGVSTDVYFVGALNGNNLTDTIKTTDNFILSNCFTKVSSVDVINKGSQIVFYNKVGGLYTTLGMSLDASIASDISTFKAYLKTQYENGTPIYILYKLQTPEELPLTESQKVVLKELQEDENYKDVMYIGSTDEIDPYIQIEYYKDIVAEHKKLQSQIDEINDLLSTTETSAMLLDNMQTDLESEV